jgi:hypothetical protein
MATIFSAGLDTDPGDPDSFALLQLTIAHKSMTI